MLFVDYRCSFIPTRIPHMWTIGAFPCDCGTPTRFSHSCAKARNSDHLRGSDSPTNMTSIIVPACAHPYPLPMWTITVLLWTIGAFRGISTLLWTIGAFPHRMWTVASLSPHAHPHMWIIGTFLRSRRARHARRPHCAYRAYGVHAMHTVRIAHVRFQLTRCRSLGPYSAIATRCAFDP